MLDVMIKMLNQQFTSVCVVMGVHFMWGAYFCMGAYKHDVVVIIKSR